MQSDNLNSPYNYINRETTSVIKGIAIILMFVHHCFTYPDWYIESISYPSLLTFAACMRNPFRLCVAIFAFLTGYFYVFSDKTYKYSFKKITDLLVIYWMIYLPILLISVLSGCYTPSWADILKECFSIINPVMFFCWYIHFYIITMLILPIISKLLDRNLLSALLIGIMIPVIAATFLSTHVSAYKEFIREFRLYFPVVTTGYICARYSLFGTNNDRSASVQEHFSTKLFRIFLFGLLLLISFMGPYIFPHIEINFVTILEADSSIRISMDILYAPLFIYSVINLYNLLPIKCAVTPPPQHIGKVLNIHLVSSLCFL